MRAAPYCPATTTVRAEIAPCRARAERAHLCGSKLGLCLGRHGGLERRGRRGVIRKHRVSDFVALEINTSERLALIVHHAADVLRRLTATAMTAEHECGGDKVCVANQDLVLCRR